MTVQLAWPIIATDQNRTRTAKQNANHKLRIIKIQHLKNAWLNVPVVTRTKKDNHF